MCVVYVRVAGWVVVDVSHPGRGGFDLGSVPKKSNDLQLPLFGVYQTHRPAAIRCLFKSKNGSSEVATVLSGGTGWGTISSWCCTRKGVCVVCVCVLVCVV